MAGGFASEVQPTFSGSASAATRFREASSRGWAMGSEHSSPAAMLATPAVTYGGMAVAGGRATMPRSTGVGGYGVGLGFGAMSPGIAGGRDAMMARMSVAADRMRSFVHSLSPEVTLARADDISSVRFCLVGNIK